MARTYSDNEREMGIAAYISTGSYVGASEITGIKPETIRSWHRRQPEEWERVSNYIHSQFEDERRAKFKEIVTKGLRETIDRLDKGNEVVDRQGKKLRVKVPAKDCATITGIMVDKLRISLGQPTNITAGKSDSPQDRLKALREEARERGIESGKVTEIGLG